MALARPLKVVVVEMDLDNTKVSFRAPGARGLAQRCGAVIARSAVVVAGGQRGWLVWAGVPWRSTASHGGRFSFDTLASMGPPVSAVKPPGGRC